MAQPRKQPKCSLTKERVKKMSCREIHSGILASHIENKITLFAAKDDNLHARFAGETRFDPTDQRFSGLRSNPQPPLSALSTSTQAWPCPVVGGGDTTL